MPFCVLCKQFIQKEKWAIRDYSNETQAQWILRHIKSLLTFGFAKYLHFHLAICEKCLRKLIKQDKVLNKSVFHFRGSLSRTQLDNEGQ